MSTKVSNELSDLARRRSRLLHVICRILQLKTMQLDDIHAVTAIGCLIRSVLALSRVNTALQVKDSLVLVEGKLLLDANRIQ